MSMDDDFPLMSRSNSVMWGPQEPAPKKTTPERYFFYIFFSFEKYGIFISNVLEQR